MDTRIEIGDKKMEVSIEFDGYLSKGEINEKGLQYVHLLYGNLGPALTLLVEKFLSTYNETWSNPEEGFPIMNAASFRKCFEFEGITILDEEKSGSLNFIDNGVMGGHFFQVDFDEKDNPKDVFMMG